MSVCQIFANRGPGWSFESEVNVKPLMHFLRHAEYVHKTAMPCATRNRLDKMCLQCIHNFFHIPINHYKINGIYEG